MARRPTPSLLQVYLFRDGDFIGTEVFVEHQIVVGRDSELCDLPLPSTEVSREHAEITVQGSQITIRDLGSTNGIYINDEKVESATVSRLDEVLIGDFTLKLKLQTKRAAKRRNTPEPTQLAAVPDEAMAGGRAVARARRPEPELELEPEPTPTPKPRPKAKPPSGRVDRARSEPKSRPDAEAEPRHRPNLRPAPEPEPEVLEPEPTVVEATHSPEAEPARIQRAAAQAAKSAPSGMKRRRRATFEVIAGLWERLPKPHRAAGDRTASPAARAAAVEPPKKRTAPTAVELPPPSAELAPVRDDDDDDEDLNYEPPFSLVERLVREDELVTEVPAGASPRLEILALQGESVVEAHLLKPGQGFWVGPKVGWLRRRKARDLPRRTRLLKLKRSGDGIIELRKQARGQITSAHGRVDVATADHLHRRRGTYVARLHRGEVLDVVDGPTRYHVRYVAAPELPHDHRPIKDRLKPDKLTTKAVGSSVGGHFVALFVVWLAVPGIKPPGSDADQFVQVSLDQSMKLEAPKPKPPAPAPGPQPKTKPQPQAQARPQHRHARMRAGGPRHSHRRARAGGTSSGPPGVLGLLSKHGSSAAPGPASVVAAVSNLSAARVPGGTSGYRVSGLQGKLPTSSLSVGGGGGGPITRGGAALLRGGGGGHGRLRGGSGNGRVRGIVQKMPRAMRSTGQGSLDRDLIQKVINRNVGQIQRCYERELLRTPNLQGKVELEWVIGTSGLVVSVRQHFSDLGSTAAVDCMLSRVKRWVFPHPHGGEVVVRFPFIFRSAAF